MTNRTEPSAEISTPCPRPASMELTPVEYDFYVRDAQRMRAEAMASIVERWFASFGRMFVRAKPQESESPATASARVPPEVFKVRA